MTSQWDCDPDDSALEGPNPPVFTCDGCHRDTYSVEDRLCRDCIVVRDRRQKAQDLWALRVVARRAAALRAGRAA